MSLVGAKGSGLIDKDHYGRIVMDNIVIWGCGYFGKKYYEHLLKYWKDSVNIIGFVDTRYDELNQKIEQGVNVFEGICSVGLNERVFSPQEVIRLYRNAQISHVFIGTSDIYYDSIKQNVDMMGIPIWEFPVPKLESVFDATDVYESEYILGDNMNICYGDLYMCCDGGIPDVKTQNTFWIFNKEKKVFSQSFNYIDIRQWKDNFIMYYPTDIDNQNVIEINEKVCVLARTYTQANLAHFMYEVLDKVIYMEKHKFDGKYLIAYRKGYEQLYEKIIKLLDIDMERIIFIDIDKFCGNVFHSKQMYIFPSITIHDEILTNNMLELYQKVKEKILEDKKHEDSITYPKKLFVKRIGSRRMFAYENIIEKYGFVEIIPEKLTVYEQMKYFYNADIIINPHGANCSNVLFMREKTCLIECFDSGYVSDFFWNIVKLKKLKYQMLVSPNQYENYVEQRGSNRDYFIPESLLISAIENAIEMAEK